MLVNLTPHAITLIAADGGTLEIPASGQVARVSQTTRQVGDLAGIPLVRQGLGEVDDLPEPDGVSLFIVSALVRTALPGRKDLVSPGDLVRDDQGAVIGCRTLITN